MARQKPNKHRRARHGRQRPAFTPRPVRVSVPDSPPNTGLVVAACANALAPDALQYALAVERARCAQLEPSAAAAALSTLRDTLEAELPARRAAAQLALDTLNGTTSVLQSMSWPQELPTFERAGEIALRAELPRPQVPCYLDVSPEGRPASVALPDPELLPGFAGDYGDDELDSIDAMERAAAQAGCDEFTLPSMTLAGALIFTAPARRVVLPFGSISAELGVGDREPTIIDMSDDELHIEPLVPVVFASPGRSANEPSPTADSLTLLAPEFIPDRGDRLSWLSATLARLTLQVVAQMVKDGIRPRHPSA